MGRLTRAFDWANSQLGPPEHWPFSLRTTVSNLLNSRFPMFLWWGPDMIQFYNDAYRPSLGNDGKHPTALGQFGKECWPEIWEIISPLIRQVQTTGEPTWNEDQLVPIFRNGKIEDVYWTYSYSAVLDDNGNRAGVLVTCTETTEKVLNEKKLEKGLANLHNMILQAPVAMCILRGPQFVVEIANEKMFEIWGREEKELLHQPIFKGLPEALDQGFEQLLQKVYNTGETYTAYGLPVHLPRNGKIGTVYLNFVYEAYREEDGTISGVMAVANEVTEQVSITKRIEESEARFRLLADSMPQFVWAGDQNGVLNYFNQAVYKYSGLTEEQMLNGGWVAIVHPDEREENIRRWMQAVETGEDFLFHHRFRNKDGNYKWQLSRAVAQKDSEGNIRMWIGTSTDIHDQKLFEEELKARVSEQTKELLDANDQLIRSNQELARSNENLEEFAYAASHDMKEPIRKIHFFADRIKNNLSTRFSAEEHRYFNRMEEASKRMGSLIDDLLSYSQVSVRPRQFEEVDLNQVLRQVLNDLELQIEEKNADLQVSELPVIRGHSRQLQQAFQNLISNALKFHHTGERPVITIRSEMVSGKDTRIRLPLDQQQQLFHLIEVSDNGIGFDQQEAERIFNVFTRLHGNAEYKGTGVGLSIVRKVAENHKGFACAIGEPGKGARFQLLFPV